MEVLVRSMQRFLSGHSGGSCKGDRLTYRSDFPSLKKWGKSKIFKTMSSDMSESEYSESNGLDVKGS